MMYKSSFVPGTIISAWRYNFPGEELTNLQIKGVSGTVAEFDFRKQEHELLRQVELNYGDVVELRFEGSPWMTAPVGFKVGDRMLWDYDPEQFNDLLGRIAGDLEYFNRLVQSEFSCPPHRWHVWTNFKKGGGKPCASIRISPNPDFNQDSADTWEFYGSVMLERLSLGLSIIIGEENGDAIAIHLGLLFLQISASLSLKRLWKTDWWNKLTTSPFYLFKCFLNDAFFQWAILSPSDSWTNDTPKWRSWLFSFESLWQRKVTTEILRVQSDLMYLADGHIPCIVTLKQYTDHCIWGDRKTLNCTVDIPEGVANGDEKYGSPNSIYSLSMPASSTGEAIIKAQNSIEEDRVKFGYYRELFRLQDSGRSGAEAGCSLAAQIRATRNLVDVDWETNPFKNLG